MLSVVEGITGPVLREVADGASLTRERKVVPAQFLGVQMVRGPAFFAERERVRAKLLSELVTPASLQAGVLGASWR